MAVILGIDPGSRACGYGLIDARGSHLSFVAMGVIRIETLDFDQRLRTIYQEISQLIALYNPSQVVIEEIFVGKSAASAIKLGQARGAAMVACANAELPFFEYATRKIKQAITGSGAADKKQMQHMVSLLLKLKSTPPQDAADALAVAICHAHTTDTLIKLSGARSSRRGRIS
jgi:crossover junction endodeoxyribonuclease RuvC